MRNLVDELMREIFEYGDPRSEPYKAGCRAALDLRLKAESVRPKAAKYPEGSPERDAFFAGVDRGHFEIAARARRVTEQGLRA